VDLFVYSGKDIPSRFTDDKMIMHALKRNKFSIYHLDVGKLKYKHFLFAVSRKVSAIFRVPDKFLTKKILKECFKNSNFDDDVDHESHGSVIHYKMVKLNLFVKLDKLCYENFEESLFLDYCIFYDEINIPKMRKNISYYYF
jgi:hypothetical protein